MDILIFNYEYPPVGGGGGVVSADIAEALATRHRVSVITSGFGGLPRRESRNDVDIHRVFVPGRRSRHVASITSLVSFPIAAWACAYRLLSERSFDVINSHFAIPTGPGSLPVAKATGIPHVLSVHGGDLYDPSKVLSPHRIWPLRRIVSAVLRQSTAVVAQSTNTRDNVHLYFDYSGPIEVIPLGVRRPAQVPTVSRRELGLPEDRFLAVTIGRLVRRKALDVLLGILGARESPDLHLAIVGSGPERSALQDIARSLGVEDRVHFMGYVSERQKWQILRCADVYVSSSMHEGFGLVYIEAMLSGLPVVTYDHGGQRDFLRNGKTGFLVPVGDENGLADALHRLREHPREARAMGEASRSIAGRYTVDRCGRAYEQLFARVCESDEALVAAHSSEESAAVH